MRASISLGRWFGIPIGLHYSWFFIAALITLSLASHFSLVHRTWSPVIIWTAAVIASVLFFVTLLMHELSHALVARSNHLPVRSITLFALGGVAQIEKESASAKDEFWMAMAGPLTSIAIGLVCLGMASWAGWTPAGDSAALVPSVLGWLGAINVALAVFNLIPGYPLDGGRVLRAVLWARSGDADRATRQAAGVGQFVAFLFIAFGLLRVFAGAGFGGLWLAFIGWFLLEAARASYAQVAAVEALRGVRVRDLMGTDCGTVEAATSLQSFVDDLLLRTGRRCFVVTGGGAVVGLVTPHEVRQVAREEWPGLSVGDVMRPLAATRTVTPQTPAIEALRIMGQEDIHQLPVVSDGHLDGIVTR
ncbi:MAG TPA: site-2 protease family protein, partial [Methylomirabilota bacterium]